MIKHSDKKVLPYPQEQIFDLIADVERYAEFVPGWSGVRVWPRAGGGVDVEQAIRLGPAEYRFSSRAQLQRPASVRITSTTGPFEHLEIHWQFQTLPSGACLINLLTSVRLRSTLLQKLFGETVAHESRNMLNLFEKRAQQLYGGQAAGVAESRH
jgi:coenzyme Q-binding protein COQ10